MQKIKLKVFSRDLPKKFKLINFVILIPILLWPLIFLTSIFIFDNPSNKDLAYFEFVVINLYPIYLFILAELNARLHFKNKVLSYLLPYSIILLIISTILYIVFSILSQVISDICNIETRKAEGWLGDCDTYKIKNERLFYNDTLVIGANTKTVKYLDCQFAVDNKYVYSGSKIIRNANSRTFEILNEFWEKDNKYVFYQGKMLPDIDAKTFEIIRYGYSRDRNHVYFYDKLVEGANPKRFKIDDFSHIGSDENGIYKEGVRE